MIGEVGSIDFDDFGQYYTDASPQFDKLGADLHELIFSHERSPPFVWRASAQIETSATDRKMNDIFLAMSKVGGSAEVGFEVEWGGNEETRFRGGISAEIHDEYGNRIEGEYRRNNEGRNETSIHGHIGTKD